MKVPEKYRITNGLMGSDPSYGCNGAFTIPHPKIALYYFNVICADGEGWQHVSVTITKEVNVGRYKQPANWVKQSVDRCPTWEEMCMVKDMFWEKDETVIQIHPPESEYVNNHKYCLHLWKPNGIIIPLPDSLLVGIKS